jgi:hypothetical protein
MNSSSGLAKFLRWVGIVFMALTAGFTVLGGAGTTCAALFPTNWESMAPLASAQWLYILYVILTIAIGILGIRSVVLLIKGASNAYKASLIALLAGVVVGVIHVFTSRALRGSSMPVDAVVGTTILTLIIFLIFRIPGIWNGVNYDKASRDETTKSGGSAAIILGVLCLTIQYWMAPTHTWNGVNYADAFNISMTVSGIVLLILGVGLMLSTKFKSLSVLKNVKDIA